MQMSLRSWRGALFLVMALSLALPPCPADGALLAAASTTSKKPASSDSSKSKSGTSTKKSTSKSTTKKSSSRSSTSSKSKPVAKPDPVTTSTPETLPGLIDKAIARVAEASHWGVKVGILETGQVLYEKNAGERFIPASNRKIFTAALVLDQLGPDFQYHTYLYRTGQITTSGTLQGNLIISPQGDPTFNNRMEKSLPPDWVFRDWVEKVAQQNIQFIDGELMVDCSNWNLRDLTPKGWTRSVTDSYAFNSSPLTFNSNMLELRVKPGVGKGPGIIEFVPSAEGYPVINQTVTGGKTAVSVKYAEDGHILVSGTVGSQSRTYGTPADNPTLFAAAVFRSNLHKRGIDFSGPLRLVTRKGVLPPPTSENVVALYKSPPMSEILKYTMKQSDNHYAEQLFVSVSAITTGSGGYSASKQLERALLQRAGINPRDVTGEDGSGLSRANFVSADEVYRMLTFMMSHPHSQVFFDSMAIAGRDGTLRGRMRTENAAERVRAKTGHINNVSSLSGYVRLPSEKTVVFSMLVNNMRTYVDSVQDRICELLSLLVI